MHEVVKADLKIVLYTFASNELGKTEDRNRYTFQCEPGALQLQKSDKQTSTDQSVLLTYSWS